MPSDLSEGGGKSPDIGLRRQAREHVLQIGIRIMLVQACRLDQIQDCRCSLAAAQRTGKQPVRASDSPGTYLGAYL